MAKLHCLRHNYLALTISNINSIMLLILNKYLHITEAI